MSTENHTYDASHIQVLEGVDAIRVRPGMYIGSTGERGLHAMAFAVARHAMNEVLAGHGSRVDVTLLPDGGLRVRSDGSTDPAGLAAALVDFTFGSGGGPRRQEIALPHLDLLHAVNALSARLELEVRHGGVCWEAGYAKGREVSPLTATGPTDDATTVVTFWVDPEVFDTTEFSFGRLAGDFRELASVYRVLEVGLADERVPDDPRSLNFGGELRDLLAFLDGEEAAEAVTFGRDDPRMPGEVEVALRWRPAGGEARELSFANGYRTEGGGTHVEGLRRGLRAAVNSYGRRRQLRTAGVSEIAWDRISDGLTVVVSVKLDDHLTMEGAVRDNLGNPSVAPCVEDAVREHLTAWLEAHPDEADALVGRMLLG